jgi:apolipoprotein N-acyltransferase
MTGLAARIGGLAGWRRRGFALLLGAFATGALPPFHLVFLLVPAFVGLLWLIDGADRAPPPAASGRFRRLVASPGGRAFGAGWWFGFGHFLTGLYWIGNSMLVDPERFAWMIPFAVGGLSVYLAAYPGLAAWATWRLAAGRPPSSLARALVLAAAWTVAEWLRGAAFTGFPWNLMGTAWAWSDAMLQPAALVGAYGLSLLTAAAAAAPAALAHRGPALGARLARVAAVLAVLGIAGAGGAARLAAAGPVAEVPTAPGVRLRLVQPNIAQGLKWKPEMRRRHLLKQLDMSVARNAPGAARPTHVIWAETAVPYFAAEDPNLRAMLGATVPAGGLMVTGAPRRTPPEVEPLQLWNSVLFVAADGSLAAGFDKFHLVPFGEYVPLRGLLNIAKLTEGTVDYSAGPGPVTVPLPGLPAASPLVCYEVIFPGAVLDRAERPGWLLNLTNDGWFGLSSGPYQHFASARLRAVEEGLPLVRVANTGISAIVDSHGRVVASLGLGREGVVEGPLPLGLTGLTPFGRFGNLIPLFFSSVVGFFASRLRRSG